MNYNIKATNIELSIEIQEYVEKRLKNSEKFVPESALMAVELEYIPGAAGPKYRAEYTLSSKGEVFRAEALRAGLHEAVDVAADELMRELRRVKKKRLHVFRKQASRIKNFLRGWK